MTHHWYDDDGKPITKEKALELLNDFDSRVLKQTWLEFMGWDILVSTMFVPVDHSPETWGRFVEDPALWFTEILGGPEDLNGTTEYYRSHYDALKGHDNVVERAVASGCSIK